jgi:hypothetical protein
MIIQEELKSILSANIGPDDKSSQHTRKTEKPVVNKRNFIIIIGLSPNRRNKKWLIYDNSHINITARRCKKLISNLDYNFQTTPQPR